MTRRTAGLQLVLLLLVLQVAACGGSTSSPVVKVTSSPWPGGAVGPVAANRPRAGVSVRLAEIRDAIPAVLPANPKQECHEGATVAITLADGRVLTYGPCDRPASIERLRVALVRAAEHDHPLAVDLRRVTGREWKSLIDDWYDGHIDGWYRCAAVHEAITHLPTPAFSTVRLDFRSYARAVCPPRA